MPLDWLEPTNSSKAVLAVLRKNATSMVDYKGPLFINPGGPGGSGVGTVQDFWKAVHVTVGANHVSLVPGYFKITSNNQNRI